jgi:hypothetical protein
LHDESKRQYFSALRRSQKAGFASDLAQNRFPRREESGCFGGITRHLDRRAARRGSRFSQGVA